MQLLINLQKLEDHARQSGHLEGRLVSLKVTQLTGGYVSLGLYRYDLDFQEPDGCIETASYVQKFTSSSEVRVMQALAGIAGTGGLPQVIDCSSEMADEESSYAHWFVTPFYEGELLTWKDAVPDGVIETLARLHVHFRTLVQTIDYLYRVDQAFFRRTFDQALAAVTAAQQDKPGSAYPESCRLLSMARDNPQLYEALDALPVTLTHGDVHPGNIIRSREGRSVLIDWGNARIAPAMLDIANMIEIDSASWHRYIAAWEAASGEAMDLDQAKLGFYWAAIIVNTQYLPFAVEYLGPDAVEKMIAKVVAAQDKIAELSSS
jgi:aminoglycoside phosphotransferase (APT) family kinase protein